MKMTSRVFLCLACLAIGRPAEAQWFFAAYLGANATRPAAVSIGVPASNLALEFTGVEFAADPFKSPQYYGWRFGNMMGRRFGVEVEFIHLKVIGKTGAVYPISGTGGALTVSPGQRMDTIVERFSMTHGLNFLVVNLVARNEISGGRAEVIARIGAGPTIPHTETTVLGGAIDRYEYAGPGAHVALGLNVRMLGRLSFVTEYKFTYARPEITIAGGKGRTTSTTHHVAAGLAFGLSR